MALCAKKVSYNVYIAGVICKRFSKPPPTDFDENEIVAMNIWNKILLGLIFVTAAFFAVLVSNRFKLTRQWEEKLLSQEKNLTDLTTQVAQLRGDIYGDSLDPATTWETMALDAKMHKLESLRAGHLWVHCVSPQAPQRDGINVRTSFCLEPTARPRQHLDVVFSQKAVVFVFDSGKKLPVEGAAPNSDESPEQAAVFLGAFTIDNFNSEANEVVITSIGTVSDAEYQRLEESAAGGNEWFAYVDRLPSDSPDDIADWLSEPENKIAALLPDEIRAFLLKRAIAADQVVANDASSVDEMQLDLGDENVNVDATAADNAADSAAESGDVVLAEAEGGAVAVAEAPEGTRYPSDYMDILERRLLVRDVLSLAIMKHHSNLKDLRHVICDQLAAIGLPEVPEEVLSKIGPTADEATAIAKRYVETKNAALIQTKIAQKEELSKRLEAAAAECDFVKQRLTIAIETVTRLQNRIDLLLVQNCSLAVKIAKAQFEAADKIIKKSENVTAVNDDSAMLLLPRGDI